LLVGFFGTVIWISNFRSVTTVEFTVRDSLSVGGGSGAIVVKIGMEHAVAIRNYFVQHFNLLNSKVKIKEEIND